MDEGSDRGWGQGREGIGEDGLVMSREEQIVVLWLN